MNESIEEMLNDLRKDASFLRNSDREEFFDYTDTIGCMANWTYYANDKSKGLSMELERALDKLAIACENAQ
jgi:hypothetical protein